MKKSLGPITLAYPTPVFLIGTFDENDAPNIMNAAWGGICCSEPPCIAVSVRPARETKAGILIHKAFTINIPSATQAAEADYAGMVSGRKHNKFADTGFTAVESSVVRAPYIKECPLCIELKLVHSFDLGSHIQFIGQILDVKIDEDCLNTEGQPDILKANPILFDPGLRNYHTVGPILAKAFDVGRKFIK